MVGVFVGFGCGGLSGFSSLPFFGAPGKVLSVRLGSAFGLSL